MPVRQYIVGDHGAGTRQGSSGWAGRQRWSARSKIHHRCWLDDP